MIAARAEAARRTVTVRGRGRRPPDHPRAAGALSRRCQSAIKRGHLPFQAATGIARWLSRWAAQSDREVVPCHSVAASRATRTQWQPGTPAGIVRAACQPAGEGPRRRARASQGRSSLSRALGPREPHSLRIPYSYRKRSTECTAHTVTHRVMRARTHAHHPVTRTDAWTRARV